MMARTARIAVVLGLALGLTACGFRPLYGRYGANPGAQRIFSSIYVSPIETERVGYNLRNSLIDLLEAKASPANAIYQLDVALHETRQGVAVQTNAAITRYNYTLDARYRLIDARTGKVVTSGHQSTLSAYNVMPSSSVSAYSTLMARQDAQRRAAKDIAYRIRLDLGVYFSQSTAHRQ
jgi:LPS-assembly lipoprotein